MTIIISIKSDNTTASGAEIRDGHRDGCILGVGDATAEGLACAGFVIFGTSQKIKNEGSRGVTMLASDASVAALVADVIARAGKIDLLVDNAGVGSSAARRTAPSPSPRRSST